MPVSEARISTDSADRYAKQLCNHASHMGARSSWAPPDGTVWFPDGGTCHVTVLGDQLLLVAEAATPSQLAKIQSIVAADLQRFGHRAGIRIDWTTAIRPQ
jgi:hypothetical protein